MLENNISNNLLSSELNLLSEEKNNTLIEGNIIDSLINTNKIQTEPKRSSIPYIFSKSTFIEKSSFNNFTKKNTIPNTEVNFINFNYSNYNNFNNTSDKIIFNVNITQQSNNSIIENSLNEVYNSNSSNNSLQDNKSSFCLKF